MNGSCAQHYHLCELHFQEGGKKTAKGFDIQFFPANADEALLVATRPDDAFKGTFSQSKVFGKTNNVVTAIVYTVTACDGRTRYMLAQDFYHPFTQLVTLKDMVLRSEAGPLFMPFDLRDVLRSTKFAGWRGIQFVD